MIEISIAKDIFDYLIAFTPVVASLISIGVAIYAVRVARRESKLNEQKLRLDLYNKRFDIFKKLIGFYNAILHINDIPQNQVKSIHLQFIQAKLESQFLFGKDIHDSLERINSNAFKIIGFKDNITVYQSDPENFIKMNNISNESFGDITKIIEEITKLLMEYLDYRNIGIYSSKKFKV